MPRPINARIVDDESHVRTFVRLLRREVGIQECREASDGGAALDLVGRHQPQLLPLDVNMPQMNGIELLARLRQRRVLSSSRRKPRISSSCFCSSARSCLVRARAMASMMSFSASIS